ncbi:extracellular solute-binding protein [Georgenia sp. MJ173]|uniref:ABC transporter substrate-binding protein n=1 Tax=Georgenia sunbinii TaxID=3117728 RepID=UPI002F266F54
MKRRKIIVTFAVGSLMLAACAQGSQTAGGDADAVTFIGDEAAILPQLEAANEVIGAETDLTFEPRTVQSTENYQQVIRSSLSSDSTTDLVKWWNGYRVQELARSGGLADLTDVWEEAVGNGWVNDDTRDSFSYEGSVYAIPFDKAYWTVYYNKSVFDDLGLSVPADWDEFVSNAEAIADADITPFFATIEPGWTAFIWFEELVSKIDPDFYVDLTEGDASYTDDVAQQAMEIWSDFYQRGFFTPADTPWDNEVPMLESGSVAMTVAGSWRNGSFADAGLTSDDYGSFVLPTVEAGTEQTVIAESGIIAAAEQGANLEGAKQWLTQLLNPDAQAELIAESKGLSANPEVVSDDEVLNSVREEVLAGEMRELTRYWEASPPALIEGNVQDMAAFMADPSPDNISSTLEAMQSRADAEWANWED